MKTRVISALVMVAIGLTCLAIGWYGIGALAIFVSTVGLYEFYKAFEEKGYHPIRLGYIYMALMILQIATKSAEITDIYFKPFGNFNISSFLQVFFVIAILSTVVLKHDKYNIIDAALTIFAGYYVVVLSGFFISYMSLPDGRLLFFGALLASVAADTFALLAGCKFGKHKLIPAVSPKKTVEGSVGSFVGTLITMTVFGIIVVLTGACTSLPIWHYPIIGLLSSLVAQFGDLSASAMKRYTGIKDFGNLIPGHGGVLDRIDSFIFVFPLIYYYFVIFAGV